MVRPEVAQHTIEPPIQEITRNESVRFDLIYTLQNPAHRPQGVEYDVGMGEAKALQQRQKD